MKIPTQDCAIQESLGSIADCAAEHLLASDADSARGMRELVRAHLLTEAKYLHMMPRDYHSMQRELRA